LITDLERLRRAARREQLMTLRARLCLRLLALAVLRVVGALSRHNP
jgi:hypothetical protein